MTALTLALALGLGDGDETLVTLGTSDHFETIVAGSLLAPENRVTYEEHARRILLAAETATQTYFGKLAYRIPPCWKELFTPGSGKRQEEMRAKRKALKEGKASSGEVIAATMALQEQATKVEKLDKELRAGSRERQKLGSETIRAQIFEAREAAWRSYIEKASKEIKP
ncbi:MAG: hypothetical protein HYY16_06040 [Planctomycetes bacterium]|nr:hypothetical protein [Planctomycetota bacterium]